MRIVCWRMKSSNKLLLIMMIGTTRVMRVMAMTVTQGDSLPIQNPVPSSFFSALPSGMLADAPLPSYFCLRWITPIHCCCCCCCWVLGKLVVKLEPSPVGSFRSSLWNVGRCTSAFVLLPGLDHSHWPHLLLLHTTLSKRGKLEVICICQPTQNCQSRQNGCFNHSKKLAHQLTFSFNMNQSK